MNEPDTDTSSDSYDDNSGAMAANSALASLEESKREYPFYAAAIKAIEEDKQVIYDVADAQTPPQIVDNVKHMGWFRDAVANEIESWHHHWTNQAKQAIEGWADIVVRFCEKRHMDLDDVQHDEDFIKQIVEQLQVEQSITNAFAYAGGASDDTDDKGSVKEVITDNETKPAKPSNLVTNNPEDTVDTVESLGVLSREVALLSEHLADADLRYNQLQTTVGQLRNTHDVTADRMTKAESALETEKHLNRKLRKEIAAYKGHIAQVAGFITKNAPRQPSAKRKAFLRLAETLAHVAAPFESTDMKPKKTTLPKKKK